MNKFGKIIIFILIVSAFAAGVYFRDDAVKFYGSLGKQVKIFVSSPLYIGGASNNVVLLQSKIIEETNLQRQAGPEGAPNLPALTENTELDEAAAAKANDLFLHQYFEHVSPTGVDPGQLVQSFGYNYIVTGQNLILGNFSSEKEVVQDWMDSPGHRANILNNRYTEIGVAIVKGTYKGETVWIGVQEFGLPVSACSEPNTTLKNQIDSEQAQLNVLVLQINDKKSQTIDDYNRLIAQYNSLVDENKQAIVKYNSEVNYFNNCVKGK